MMAPVLQGGRLVAGALALQFIVGCSGEVPADGPGGEMSAGGPEVPADPQPALPADPGSVEFSWDLPAGWEEAPLTSMRQANFRVAGEPDAECYLTFLPGSAGGVAANVNRWRGQMGLEVLAAAEVEALPRRELTGGDAVFVDMSGGYRGMGVEAEPDYRMAGLILESPRSTLFLKMVGPASVIDGEMVRFEELARSISAHVVTPAAEPSTGADANSAEGLSWDLPDGWARSGERAMRLVTLAPLSAPEAECYVTFLPGPAGGVRANLNRWRGQMGQPELTSGEVGQLPRYAVLGSEAVFIEIEGDFVGMGDDRLADAGFLGLIGEAGAGTLFVKMTGPREVIAAERRRFLEFCQSLSVDGGI